MNKLIFESIKTHDTIIIHRHVRPDPDALGSQGGLGALLKASFPEKKVYLVGEEDPALTFLVTMDEIAETSYEDALVIVCDSANTARISDRRYKLGKQLIKIDHHPNEEPYGDVVWVDTSVSSTSEMIVQWFLAHEDEGLVMTAEAASLLYAGIIGDTGRFLYSNTSPDTLRAAAFLMEKGAVPQDLFDELYKVKENTARLNGYVMQNFKITNGHTGSIHLSKTVLDRYGVEVSEAAVLVNSFAHVEGMLAWVFFIDEPGHIRTRIRSKGPAINQLAMRYNGGGHPRASGATVHSLEEGERLVDELTALCEEYVQKHQK
ncbi:phosphoesterase RecJ domain-containing protein [Fictibacillus macauensis ZFHKF-1]|uniref:Phosphoesterase RecJ domain-containing protein n=1 Tax=Fictibacillus macauensis ZFHKF-1 TaxID=1196324 RepID=I8UF01_9BACL|nr:bifunctional oligoribonuclease/PAP phosphatase NrnA [Fictibacillus macauensis]EIT85450.1 phosphoesterase RecJ domain-containing protein [Fictibacillus macauensis ZFHKF-1]